MSHNPAKHVEQRIEFPGWIREALENGEATDNLPNKRRDSRRSWTGLCIAEPVGEERFGRLTVRLFNVGSGGVGFIARQELPVGALLSLVPEAESGHVGIHVRVVHCTRTLQGYKVGCAFEPAQPIPRAHDR